MKKVALACAFAVVLSGCADQMAALMGGTKVESLMQQAIGSDVTSIIARYGQPTNSFDTPDGRRAFQWVINQAHNTGSTYQAQYYPALNMAMGTSSGSRTTYSGCVFTIYGQRNSYGSYTVVGYEKPRPSCAYAVL